MYLTDQILIEHEQTVYDLQVREHGFEIGGSHMSSESQASSILKLNKAKERKELARLKLQQLEKLKELEFKRLNIASQYKQAALSKHIWGSAEVTFQKEKQECIEEQECIEDQAVKRMGSQSSLHVPFTDEIKHNYLNSEGVNHVTCTSKDARNPKANPNFQENVNAPLPPFQSNKDNDQSVFRNVVGILNEGFNMPKPELLTINGNPLNY